MALLSKLDICSQAGLLLHAARGIVYLFTVEYISLLKAVIRSIASHVDMAVSTRRNSIPL
jgi:hypothetical protein